MPMEKYEEVHTALLGKQFAQTGGRMGSLKTYDHAAGKICMEVDEATGVIRAFKKVGSTRVYDDIPEAAEAIVEELYGIAGGAPEQDSESEDEYVEADYEIVDDTAEQEKETKHKERKQMKETSIEPVHQDQNAALAAVDAMPITLDTVKAHICKTASDQELKLFIEICRSHNLNPFIDEIYLIKYPGSAANTVVGKGVFLERAFNNPNFDGFEAGIIVIDESGKLIRREGAFRLDNETLVGGWAKVHMKNKKHPYVNEVRLKDYIKTKKDGKPTKFWAMMAETMIRKVPLTQTLKEAMPGEFNQLWDADALVIDAEVVD